MAENADIDFPERRIIILKKAKANQKKHLTSLKDVYKTSLENKGLSHNLSVFMSNDFFRTSEELVKNGNRFALTKYYLFIATATDLETQEVSLYVSLTCSRKYNFNKAKLPFSLLREHSYTILDTMQHQVFLHVTHSVSDLSYGHIYISNSLGNKFTLSQKYNIKNDHNFCDFDRIKGMQGIYIINHFDKSNIERARFELSILAENSVQSYKNAEVESL